MSILPGLYAERGEGFVEALEGPFAIALWDPAKERLLLARDRAGERPLFYCVDEAEITFATELSALVEGSSIAWALDRDGLRHYLRFGRFAAPETPERHIRKLAPAEIVCLGRNTVSKRTYWRFALGTAASRDPDVAAFDAVFREAVRRQSASDVDFGLFLSGGVDSSLVAAVTRSLYPERPLRAYTLRFSEASYDEGDAAARVAERLGLANEIVWVRAESFPQKIRELVRMVGEPLADPAWVPTALLAERAARDVKVVLVGEGGDEVFGGYPTYLGALLAGRYARLPGAFRRGASFLIKRWPVSDRKVTLSFLLKRFVDGAEMPPMERHLLWTSVIPPAVLERLGVPPPEVNAPATGEDVLAGLQRYDLESYLAEGLLTKADRASLGWALEPRAPFLDRAVLDFAASLPPRERVAGLRTKVFLKRYAGRYLPRSTIHQRKRGLSVPLAAWLRGPLETWAREELASGRLDPLGVSPRASLDLFEEHLLKRADWGRALWALLVLTEWMAWWNERAGASRYRPNP